MAPTRRTVALAGVLAVGLIFAAAAQTWTRVRVGTEGAYPPGNHGDSAGRLIGFEIDLARDLCSRMKVEGELVTADWESIIPALQAGAHGGHADHRRAQEADPVLRQLCRDARLFRRAEEQRPGSLPKRAGAPPARPVEAVEQAALDTLRQAFAGRIVGVQVATPQPDFLEEYFSGAVEIQKYDIPKNLDLDLQAGRVDLALDSMSYWQPLLETEKGADVTLIGPGMTGGPFGEEVGVGIRRENTELVGMFNPAIVEAKADGTIARLAQQWLGFDASS